jgi:hypothetical protein
MRWNKPAPDVPVIWIPNVLPPDADRVVKVGAGPSSDAGPGAALIGYDATLASVRGALRRGDWATAEALLMRAAPLAGEDAAFFNLVGVLWEVRAGRRAARRFYGLAIRSDGKYAPAQQNMRRLYELSTFGRTRQAVALGDEPAPP